MRIVTWNCRVGGFRKKAKHVASLRPDILAVQEVEAIDSVLLFTGECQPTFRDRLAGPSFPRRGTGMFSYTDTQLRAVDVAEPMWGFRRYEAQRGQLSFHVASVWTYATKSADSAYRQAHHGLLRHADWIRQRPTVILGDFNGNASFKGPNWSELMTLAGSLGLVSAYHRHFDEPHGAETRPTHFWRGQEDKAFHLDYCFLPQCWAPLVKRVEVGLYCDWRGISDHVPLIVDLDL